MIPQQFCFTDELCTTCSQARFYKHVMQVDLWQGNEPLPVKGNISSHREVEQILASLITGLIDELSLGHTMSSPNTLFQWCCKPLSQVGIGLDEERTAFAVQRTCIFFEIMPLDKGHIF